MSINDPQWGNSHRPDSKDPEQVPENTGTEPVQPEADKKDSQQQRSPVRSPQPSPPEGPPDLEELWQQLVYKTRCQIARLFGRPLPEAPTVSQPAATRSGLPADTPTDASPLAGLQTLSFKSWLIGVSLTFGAWLVSGFYLVDPQQRGVLSRFGSVVALEDPGWHWRWPYPIDSVRLVNVSADRTMDIGLSAQKGQRQSQGLMLTADGSLAAVAYAVVYQVTDPVRYLSRADEPADLLALLAEESLRRAVSAQTLPTLLASGQKQTAEAGAAMLQTAKADLQTALEPLQLGIVVKDLLIREVQLPTPVLQAVKETEREEQARAKALRESQAASTERLIKARKLAAKLQDESAAYAGTLDNEIQTLRTAGAKPDKTSAEAAQKALQDKASQWRQQYPLVFASPAMLKDLVQPARPAQPGNRADRPAPVSQDAASATIPPATDAWRDRDIMRSRDRVDRPGSGS